MQDPQERLAGIMRAAHVRLRGRMRSALLVALLLAALVWYTRWPGLRTGLAVLLVTQSAVAIALYLRSRRLVREWQTVPAGNWFDEQSRFIKALGVFESASRALGFLILGWGFWTATRSLAMAAALGIVYPALAYFGMERRNQTRALHELKAEKDAFALHSRAGHE